MEKVKMKETDDFDETVCRPFTSGSRDPPDKQDGFLENAGFYRKHTARDASSLFRVVSEQVLDVQLYHEKVRQDCANFIEKHRTDYEKEMDKNHVYYISNLRKLKTPGSLLELKAMAHCYKRNVMLFEPYTAGKWFVEEEGYKKVEPLRVFYSSDKHFDSIFTKDDIEVAAKCQGLIFEILYKEIFKLADVNYAVERMLHDQNEETTKPLEDDKTKYQTMAGKVESFDTHENTSCVLEDSQMCHFHNRKNFEEFVDSHNANLNNNFVAHDGTIVKYRKKADGFLHDKDKSCVRQLLDEKITPFPYKVAKALDRSIYRNIEFDMWNDNRKELRSKWLEGNQMDHARVPKKLVFKRRGKPQVYSNQPPHSQEIQIPYLVGEKKEMLVGADFWKMNGNKKVGNSYVKYSGRIEDEKGGIVYYYPSYGTGYGDFKDPDWEDDLKKKPYVMIEDTYIGESYNPFKYNPYNGYHQAYPYETIVMPTNINHHRGFYKSKRGGGRGGMNGARDNNHNTGYAPFNNNHEEKSDGNLSNQNSGQSAQDYQQSHNDNHYNQPFNATPGSNNYYDSYAPYETQQAPIQQQQQPQQQQNLPPIPLQQYAAQPQASGWHHAGTQVQYFGQHPTTMPPPYGPPMMPFCGPPPFFPNYATYPPPFFNPQSVPISTQQHSFAVPQAGISVCDNMSLIKEKEINGSINFNARESCDFAGKDLPQDVATLQFYYNLGVRYFYACSSHQSGANPADQCTDQCTEANCPGKAQQQQHEQKTDLNNDQRIGTTPVSTKPGSHNHHAPTGRPNQQNNYHNNNGGNNYNKNSGGGWGRKPFPNRNSYTKRNDVQFNSNVKNAPKNDGYPSQKNIIVPVTSSSTLSTQNSAQSAVSVTNTVSAPNISPISPENNNAVELQSTTCQTYQPQPVYSAPVVSYYQEGQDPSTGYIQQYPAYYTTVPMAGPPPQTQVIYQQQQQIDGNMNADSAEAQYNPNAYQPSIVYVNQPPPQNYVYYSQPVPQAMPTAVQTVPSGPNSGASM